MPITASVPRLELKIKTLLSDFQNLKIQNENEKRRCLDEPLSEILDALSSDYENDKNLSCFIYKIGELSLIIRNIGSVELEPLAKKIEKIISGTDFNPNSDSYIRREYLKYVIG